MLLIGAPVLVSAPTGATLLVAPIPDAEAAALSGNGKTLVGTAGGRAFAWQVDEAPDASKGLEILSDPGSALAVSDDGSVIVGNGLKPGQAQIGRHRWIGTIPSLEPPYGPRIGGVAAGVSGDGTLVVGSAIMNYVVTQNARGKHAEGVGEAAFLSLDVLLAFGEAGESPTDIPPPQGLDLGWRSAVTAVSHDGTTLVGTLAKPGPAFRWNERDGAVPLGDLEGGGVETVPRAVDEAGATIVGSARSANGVEAFRWTEAEGMVPLGDLPGNVFRSVARGVTTNGRIVVGWGSGASVGDSGAGERAFVWDAKNGMRDLWEVLKAQGQEGSGLPARFSRWRLRDAVSVRITPDGHPQIAGTASDAGGRRVAFVATLAETVEP